MDPHDDDRYDPTPEDDAAPEDDTAAALDTALASALAALDALTLPAHAPRAEEPARAVDRALEALLDAIDALHDGPTREAFDPVIPQVHSLRACVRAWRFGTPAPSDVLDHGARVGASLRALAAS